MISDERKKHIFGVAELLKQTAIKNNYTSKEIEELFTLGLVHDIGYEFLEPKDYSKHNKVGGEILKNQGYKYWQEVYFHGEANSPYQSKFLDLLNFADAHIDGYGNYVSFEDRLKDISKRYNIPIDKVEIKLLIDELNKKGYN